MDNKDKKTNDNTSDVKSEVTEADTSGVNEPENSGNLPNTPDNTSEVKSEVTDEDTSEVKREG